LLEFYFILLIKNTKSKRFIPVCISKHMTVVSPVHGVNISNKHAAIFYIGILKPNNIKIFTSSSNRSLHQFCAS